MTALLQQALTILQQGAARQCPRTLSMYSQVEPARSNSRMTRVGHHPRLKMPDNPVLYLTPISVHIACSSLSCFRSLSNMFTFNSIAMFAHARRQFGHSALGAVWLPTSSTRAVVMLVFTFQLSLDPRCGIRRFTTRTDHASQYGFATLFLPISLRLYAVNQVAVCPVP